MQIDIEIAAGKTFALKVNPSITVHELKTLIEALEGVEHEQQRLQLDGKVLLDFFTLNEAGISDGCKIILTQKKKLPRPEEKFSFQPLRQSVFSAPYTPTTFIKNSTEVGNRDAAKKSEDFQSTPLFAAPGATSQFTLKPKPVGQSLFDLGKPVTLTPSGIFGVPVPTIQPSLFATKSNTKVVSLPFPKNQDANDQANNACGLSPKTNEQLRKDSAILSKLKNVLRITKRIEKISKEVQAKHDQKDQQESLPQHEELSDDEEAAYQSDSVNSALNDEEDQQKSSQNYGEWSDDEEEVPNPSDSVNSVNSALGDTKDQQGTSVHYGEWSDEEEEVANPSEHVDSTSSALNEVEPRSECPFSFFANSVAKRSQQ